MENNQLNICKVKLVGICKSFPNNPERILNNIDYEFESGNFYLIKGDSGSGKTTLFNIIGTLDKPDYPVSSFSEKIVIWKKGSSLKDLKTALSDHKFFKNESKNIEKCKTKKEIAYFLNKFVTPSKKAEELYDYYAYTIYDFYKKSYFNGKEKENTLKLNENEKEYFQKLSNDYKKFQISKIKDFKIQESEQAIFLKLFINYHKNDKRKKMHFNRLLIETIFADILYDNPEIIQVRYYGEKDGYSLFSVGDILKWEYFVKSLKKERDTESDKKQIWNFLKEESKELIKNWEPGKTLNEKFKKSIIKGLNEILMRRDFYRAEAFDKIELSKEAKELYVKGVDNLSDNQIQKFNRFLFEAIYPQEIAKSHKDEENPIAIWDASCHPMKKSINNLRKNYVKVVYQDFRLIDCFTYLENVLISENNSDDIYYKKIFNLIHEFSGKILIKDLPPEISLLYQNYMEKILINEYGYTSNELHTMSDIINKWSSEKNIKIEDNTKVKINDLIKKLEDRPEGDFYKDIFNETMKESRKKKFFSNILSGGQKQVNSLICAAENEDVKGKIFLADEPTGQVHVKLKNKIFEFLAKLSKNNIVIVVSHEGKIKKLEQLKNNNKINLIKLELKNGELKELKEN